MTEQSEMNFKTIDSLVSKYFALDIKSILEFRKVLYSREEKLKYIDEQFHELLDDDLRAYFPLLSSVKSDLDDGWNVFKSVFDSFLTNVSLNVTYENYVSNKILINKNEVKLFKYIKSWYLERSEDERHEFGKLVAYNIGGVDFSDFSDFELVFKRASEKIGTMKLPNKELKIVLSFNFADWFLVSSAESWSSCLNLESDYESCYWSGLPGLITDPNRLLFYITDGKTKKYKGIITDKFITRTWGLLDITNKVFPVRHYPQQIVKDYAMSQMFPFSVYSGSLYTDNSDFVRGKHMYENLLQNYLNESVYIYQDGTIFECSDDNKVCVISGHSGYHKICKDGSRLYIDGDTPYDYCDGLSGLIDSCQTLQNCRNTSCECANCGDHYDEDDMTVGPDDRIYCSDCFNEEFVCCDDCGEVMARDEAFYSPDGDTYCERHFDEMFFVCSECGEVFNNDDMFSHNGDRYCEECFSDRFVTCNSCEDTFKIKRNPYEYKVIDDTVLCVDCYEQLYTTCKKCESEILIKDSHPVEDGALCETCMSPLLISPELTEMKGVA